MACAGYACPSIHLTDSPAELVPKAATVALARQDVQQAGGTVERDLVVIHAVSAYLDGVQAAGLRARSDVRIFADRSMRTDGLLSLVGSLTAPVQTVTNSVNSTVATNPVVKAVTTVTTPLTATVTQVAQPVVAPLTGPVVGALSSNTALTDGTGVAALTLLYQTNYPQLVGADKLQAQGITGRGVTIAMLDTGLWISDTDNHGTDGYHGGCWRASM